MCISSYLIMRNCNCTESKWKSTFEVVHWQQMASNHRRRTWLLRSNRSKVVETRNTNCNRWHRPDQPPMLILSFVWMQIDKFRWFVSMIRREKKHISKWIEQDNIRTSWKRTIRFGFLKDDYIGTEIVQRLPKNPFEGSQSVYIPRDDFHNFRIPSYQLITEEL